MEHKLRMEAVDLERAGEIGRVTWVGFWINVVLSIIKISAGFLGNSRAVVADGVHSLSDLITDIAVIVGVRFWVAPPDENHPYGHKRLESLVSLAIGIILAVAGVGIAVDAISRVGDQGDEQIGSVLALGAALLSVVVKEILYRWTIKKGQMLKSDAVIANAWDHRSDAISSIPIAIAVAISMWFPDWAIVDLVGAMIVALFILHASWKICLPAANVLLDIAAEPHIRKKIIDFVEQIHGVRGVHALRTRYLGQGLQLDLHVNVDADLTVREGNDIAHCLEEALYSPEASENIGVEISDVLVHIDPWEPDLKNTQ